jgi:hypothetical protein
VEEFQSAERLDIFSPLFVTALVLGFAKDFASLFLLGVGIPVVGQVIAAYVLALTAFVALFFIFAIMPKLQHFVPKLILSFTFLPLPVPGFTAGGLILAVVAQNRLVELVLTQVAIQAVAVATGGAGEALEGVATAEKLGAGGLKVAEIGEELGEAKQTIKETKSLIKKAGRAAERGLRRHEENLKEELGEEAEENGVSAEEVFGLKEPTEKAEELFEPEYNIPQNQEGETDTELQARQKFESKKQREAEERRLREDQGIIPVPIPRPEEARKEVELEKAA